jgi:uncharacterized protein YdaU (DUF1376 family)
MTSHFSPKHLRILAFIRHYNKLIVNYYDDVFANNIYVRDDNLENISFLDRNTDELKTFLDSFFESEDSVVKDLKKEFNSKKKDQVKREKEEEKRVKKDKQKIVKSTKRECEKRCKKLLDDLSCNSHELNRFIVNHGEELLEKVPGITQDLRIVLRNPSDEIINFIKSTVIVEEKDYSRKKHGTVTVNSNSVVDEILARNED